MAEAVKDPSLGTRRGKAVLALLCAVAFLDFVDASIVNVALPSIRSDLGFSEQSLQWVPSAYLLTYGGFMLLGGRAADLLGRRRILVTGTVIIANSSLLGGLAQGSGLLIGDRLAQGIGAAMMLPAALSILTTTFREGPERHRALGVWGGVGGLASAVGVLFGGLLTEGPGWRWVMFVNPLAAVFVLACVFALLTATGRGARHSGTSTCSAHCWLPRACCSSSTAGRSSGAGMGLGADDLRPRRRRRTTDRLRPQRAPTP
jgi:MFS family permease